MKLNQDDQQEVCDYKGISCLQKKLKQYRDDLEDRQQCKCLNDCEMLHFFATKMFYSYNNNKETMPEKWYDPKTSSGILANYLEDPKNVFMDQLIKNLMKLR